MGLKKNRHNTILEIIANQEIDTQEELARQLREAGYDVTQATVSRDIRELNLYKVSADGGKQKYAILRQEDSRHLEDKYIRVLKDGFSSMDMAQDRKSVV